MITLRDIAEAAGISAARQKQPADTNPYPPGMDERSWWDEGWRIGMQKGNGRDGHC
jgi:hypothetical protein